MVSIYFLQRIVFDKRGQKKKIYIYNSKDIVKRL